MLRLLPGSDRDKDTEILALRHRLVVLHRQLSGERVRFEPAYRAWLAALLSTLPRASLRRLRLDINPATVGRYVAIDGDQYWGYIDGKIMDNVGEDIGQPPPAGRNAYADIPTTYDSQHGHGHGHGARGSGPVPDHGVRSS